MSAAAPKFEIRANAFGLIGETASHPMAYWAPPLVGLLAAACLAFFRCPVPPSHSLSWASLFGTATAYVLSAFMAGPIAMITMYAIFRRRAELDIRDVTLRTASAAVWFAPLVIFLSERSMWAITAAGVLAASETRLLRSYHDAMLGGSGPGALDGLPPGEIFHLLPSRALRRLPFSALCASATAQAGGVAGLAGYPLPGAMLLGISTAVVAWSSGAMRGWGQQQSTSLARSAFRVTLILVLATTFTAASLTRYLEVKRGSGWGSAQYSRHKIIKTASSLLDTLFRAPKSRPFRDNLEHASEPRGDSTAIVIGSVHPGVILWPEIRARSMVVPPLPAMGHGLFATRHANPLSIPFFGVYWLFKAPDNRPPDDSFRARGNPAAHTFFTTDHMPMLMEANQNLGTLIDLSCCSKIQLAISNADPYPGSVSLELILVNTTLPSRPSQSLGSTEVKSKPRWRPFDDGAPLSETLTFALPATSSLRNFDEVKISFHLDAVRAETAARIAIERFLFVPR